MFVRRTGFGKQGYIEYTRVLFFFGAESGRQGFFPFRDGFSLCSGRLCSMPGPSGNGQMPSMKSSEKASENSEGMYLLNIFGLQSPLLCVSVFTVCASMLGPLCVFHFGSMLNLFWAIWKQFVFWSKNTSLKIVQFLTRKN